jgi:hypothetical protein
MPSLKKLALIATLGTVGAGMFAIPAHAQEDVYRYTFQSAYAAADPQYIHFTRWAERIAEYSGGRLVIETQPAGTIVDAFEVLMGKDRDEMATPPRVSFVSPADGATISGMTMIEADTFDDHAEVAGVQYWLDKGPHGGPLGQEVTSAPYSLRWDTTTTSDGTHSLTAVVRNAEGNTTETSITVKVDNTLSRNH